MEIKAKDICTKCKYCLGMTSNGMYSCGYANDGSELNIGIDVTLSCANFEEVNMNKVEGKVADFCPKCKNGSVIVWKGVSNIVCEDPYDGMVKILDADSDICCSMFEIKSEKKATCDKISLLQHELEMDKLRMKIHQLEKEKAAHLKGIERLKKSQEKLQNQVKNLQTTNEESYKREEKLEDKVHKLERRLLDENKRFRRLNSEFLIPLSNVLYPDVKICKPYSEVLKDIQLLKLANYNLKDDNKRLAERNKTLDERNTNQCVMIGERDKEIKNLKETNESLTKMVERRDRWVDELKNDVYTLQNEILTIRDIAQKAYDDTNRD